MRGGTGTRTTGCARPGTSVNPIIEGLWDPDRMKGAEENDRRVDSHVDDGSTGGGTGGEGDEGVTGPGPAPRKARPVTTPYRKNAPAGGQGIHGHLKGPTVCSGTVVEDPRSPGKSNLVATAGHRVHAGSDGGWFRNVVFVPAHNDSAPSASRLEQASSTGVAPHGVFWATWAQTTEHWISNGSETGGLGASQDFAVLRVEAEDRGGKSLEETVGTAVPVDFGKPSAARAEVGAARRTVRPRPSGYAPCRCRAPARTGRCPAPRCGCPRRRAPPRAGGSGPRRRPSARS